MQPIHIACVQGQIDVVCELIDVHGVAPNAENEVHNNCGYNNDKFCFYRMVFQHFILLFAGIIRIWQSFLLRSMILIRTVQQAT